MTKIYWKNHFIEILVVIFGILIAFQLNQCSTEANQEKLVTSHLEYIKQETEVNLRNLEFALNHAESSMKSLDTLLLLIQQKGSLDSINRLCLKLLNVGGVYLKKNAYQSLIESGDIRFLDDFDKKQDIINLYEYYKWTESFDSFNIESFSDGFFPYVQRHMDLLNSSVQERSVYDNKEFLNILSTYKYSLNGKIEKYKDCKNEMTEFLNDY